MYSKVSISIQNHTVPTAPSNRTRHRPSAAPLAVLTTALLIFALSNSVRAACYYRGVDQVAYAVTADWSGNVYVGGNFLSAGSVSVDKIAKYNIYSHVWSKMTTGTDYPAECDATTWPVDSVYALLFDFSDSIYVGGSFGTVGYYVGGGGIAKWNISSQTWSSLGGISAGGKVNSLALSSSGVVAAGHFSSAGGSAGSGISLTTVNNIGLFSGGAWSNLGPTPMTEVLKVKNIGGSLYICGAGGIYVYSAGAWSAVCSATSIADFEAGTYQGHGGFFTAGSGGLQFFDLTTQSFVDISNNSFDSGGPMYTLLNNWGTLYAGGDPSFFIDGQAAYGAFAFNPTAPAWSLLPPTSGVHNGLYGTVNALAFSSITLTNGGSNAVVYAVGSFNQTGAGLCVDNVAAWDTLSGAWHELGINDAPTVSISSPANGAQFVAPATIALQADAADDCLVTNVSFYTNSVFLGKATSSPWSFEWDNVPAGTYTVTAVATDNEGVSTTSSSITVSVHDLQLLNFTFGSSASPCITPTVTITGSDYWNTVGDIKSGSPYVSPALDHTGTPTSVTLGSPGDGDYSNGDCWMATGGGEDIEIPITLPHGTYSFYMYNHDVNGVNYATDYSVEIEGVPVSDTDLSLLDGTTVTIRGTAFPEPIISALQIQRTSD